MFVSETFSIEDCIKAYMQTYLDFSQTTSVTETFDYNLPSTFKIEYETLITQTNNNSCFFRVGETDTKALLVGKVSSSQSNWQIYARNGTDIITTGSTITPSNNWQSMFMSFNGTTFNFNDDISITNLNGVTLSKLHSIIAYHENTTSGQLRNIKIKPL